MKLAMALSRRADLQKQIAALRIRLNNNARVQEGEKPAEDPTELFHEGAKMFSLLENLITDINLTNARTLVDGKPLTELLAKRDVMTMMISTLQDFSRTASDLGERVSRSEIKIKSTLNPTVIQKDIHKLSKQLRELDEKIQEINWTTELVEYLPVETDADSIAN